LITIRDLEHIKVLSDHAPILLTTGSHIPQSKHQFKFNGQFKIFSKNLVNIT
jgi:predicted secreted Zn-dependent protease